MMKKNLKKIIVAVALLVVVSSAIFAVYAYLSSKADAKNKFVPAQVSCQVDEEVSFAKDADGRDQVLKTEVTVQNTSNVGAYLRIVAVTYWQDSRGGIIYKPSDDLGFASNYDASKWIFDEENNIFYYREMVKKGEETADLLKDGKTIVLKSFETEDKQGIVFEYYQVVEFIAEAIQATPANAVTDSWGVTLDGDGNINGLKQQSN